MSNELKVIEQDGRFVIDSRDVATMIEKEHDQLMRSIRTYIEYLESAKMQSHNFFIEHTYINTQNKTQPCYLLTKKGCDMVANKMIGAKGVLFTAEYVTKFEEMENKLKQRKLPTTFLEALKELVIVEEEKLLLEADNKAKQQQIEEMQPKAEFADKLLKSKDNVLVREYAKILQDEGFTLGERKLYEWFKNRGYLMQNREPYQQYMRYFAIKESTIDTPWGEKITKTTKINPEGQLYFYKKLNQEFHFSNK